MQYILLGLFCFSFHCSVRFFFYFFFFRSLSNFNFIFIFLTPLGYVGLALSTALSGTVNAISLFQGLYRRHVYRPGRSTLFFMLRLSAATAAMYLLLWWLSPTLEVWVKWSMWRSGLELCKLVVVGGLCYLLAAGLLGIRPRDLKTVNEG